MIYVQRNKLIPSIHDGIRSERLAIENKKFTRFLVRREVTFEKGYIQIRAEDWKTGEDIRLWELSSSDISKMLYEHGFKPLGTV